MKRWIHRMKLKWALHLGPVDRWKMRRQQRKNKEREWLNIVDRPVDEADLESVKFTFGLDLTRLLGEWWRRNPKQKIEVLDEGTGNSTWAQEWMEELGEKSRYLSVHRTDIRSVREDPGMRPVEMVPPEKIVKHFGKNRFHIIVSHFSGVAFTPLNRIKAIANIIGALRPGGHAFFTVWIRNEYVEKQHNAVFAKVRKLFPEVTLSMQRKTSSNGMDYYSVHIHKN